VHRPSPSSASSSPFSDVSSVVAALRGALGRASWLSAALVLACCASSGGLSGGPSFAPDPTLDNRDLETSLSVEPPTIREGETVELVLTIENTSDRTVQLRFPRKKQVGLAVYDEADLLYYTDTSTIAMPRVVTLGPLQSWSRDIEWDGTIDIGPREEHLPPGEYELQAGLHLSGDVYVNRTNRVSIEVLAK
jgi:hypothetical protein